MFFNNRKRAFESEGMKVNMGKVMEESDGETAVLEAKVNFCAICSKNCSETSDSSGYME